MTDSKNDDTAAPAPRSRSKKTTEDPVAAEAQARMDEATAKGYIGWVPDENPNSAYSLESGPDGVVEIAGPQARAAQPLMPEGNIDA